MRTPELYVRGVALLNSGGPEIFSNPITSAWLTAIFINEKKIKYLQTACCVLASADRIEQAGKMMDELYMCLFPEDDSRERFEERAARILPQWLKKKITLSSMRENEYSVRIE